MERTKFNDKQLPNLPDAINCSFISEYTSIPNDFLRNPNISAKAKTILCILLSNKNGWRSHVSTLESMMMESKPTIQKGLKELEVLGYLIRIKYRDKTTKMFKGAFWAYTDDPGCFNLESHIKRLETLNLQAIEPQLKKPRLVKPASGFFSPKNTNNIKNLKDKKNNIIPQEEKNDEISPVKESIEIRTNKYLPIAQRLSNIIKSNKNITHTTQQIKSWANDIRRLIEDNSITTIRIDTALDWYEKNIGGEYVPVIESGNSLRYKFEKLEAAVERSKKLYNNKPQFKVEFGEKWYLNPDGVYRNRDGKCLNL